MEAQGSARLWSLILLVVGIIIEIIGLILYFNAGADTNYSGGALTWTLIIVGIVVIFLSMIALAFGRYNTYKQGQGKSTASATASATASNGQLP